MKRLAFRNTFLSSYNYFWCGPEYSITHWLPNVLYTMCAPCMSSSAHLL